MTEWKNILFKEIENRKLYLDLFVPEDVPAPPIIMWVHGGGWNELNRTWSLIMPMLERGYAVASVDYRYCDEAAFPAQMSDLKDALLFLKKHGDAYGYEDSTFECYHPEMVADPFAMDEYYDLKCALAHLNDTQRRRIIKRFYEDMSNKEIASEEHISEPTASLSIQHALKKIKNILEQT